MRYEQTAEYDGSDEAQCHFDSVCLGMETAGFSDITAQFGFCTNSTSCSHASERSSSFRSRCVAIGGDPAYTSDLLCNNKTSADVRAKFFQPNDTILNSHL